MPRVISLTSIPPRFDRLYDTLETLCAQRAGIDEIVVHIPRHYRRFPGYDGALPRVPKGVRVTRVEEDLGPASKVVHAATELRGQDDVALMFCDDDRAYLPGLARHLFAEHDKRPGTCVAGAGYQVTGFAPGAVAQAPSPQVVFGKPRQSAAYRLTRIGRQIAAARRQCKPEKMVKCRVTRPGYGDVLQGYAGAVVSPDAFDDAATSVAEESRMVDDIWLSGHLARRGIPIWIAGHRGTAQYGPNADVDPLQTAEFAGRGRAALNRAAVTYFQTAHGLWTA